MMEEQDTQHMERARTQLDLGPPGQQPRRPEIEGERTERQVGRR
jgi:hypothetical protein